MLSWGFGDFFIQKGTRKIGDVETLAWIGIFGSIGLVPFIYNDLTLVLERSNFLILLSLGVVTFLVGIMNFEALRRGKLSVVEVLLELELPITVILGIFFLREHLTLTQVLILCFIFVGILMIALKPGQVRGRHFFEKGAVLALGAAIGYGLINFLTAVGAKEIAPLLTIWCTWVTFTVICLGYLFAKGRIKSFAHQFSKYTTLIIAMGVIDTVAWIFFALALENKELAVTIAITESYPAVSLFLGSVVNKEKIATIQFFGAFLTIVASIVMALLY